MVKKLLLFLAALIVLTGCEETPRLNERAIVQAIGIDYIPELDLFKLAILVFSPEGGGGPTSIDPNKSNAKIIISQGKSQSEAFKNATMLQGKELFLGDNRLVLIGYEASKEKLPAILGLFNTNHETRSDVAFATTTHTAAEIIQLSLSQGLTPVEVLSNLLKNTKIHGKGIRSTLLDVSQDYLSATVSPVLPVLEIHSETIFDEDHLYGLMYEDEAELKKKEILDSQKNEADTIKNRDESGDIDAKSGEQGADPTSSAKETPEEIETLTKVKLDGSAVFLTDKLVGYLDEYESRGLAFIRGELDKTVYQASTDAIESGSFRIYDATSNIRLNKSVESPLTLDVNIKAKATILGITLAYGIQRADDAQIAKLTKEVEKQIYDECHDVIYKSIRVYNADIFHFGDTIWKQDPELWRTLEPNFSHLLQTMQVNVNVQLNVNRVGLEYRYELQ